MTVLPREDFSSHHEYMVDQTQPQTVFWLSAHPERRSLNGNLRTAGIEYLRRNGHRVIESDLYAMAWNPVVTGDGLVDAGEPFNPTSDTRQAFIEGRLPADVAREQDKLRVADALVVQFPLWWYSVPAILKGWFDRVLISGFAFGKDPDTGTRLRFENGPFRGTRVLVVVTLGDRPQAIGPRGKSGELCELLFGLLHGTFAYTGMDVLPPMALPSADFTDHDSYPLAEQCLLDRLDHLFITDRIHYRPQFQGDYTEEWDLAPEVRPGETGLSVHILDATE